MNAAILWYECAADFVGTYIPVLNRVGSAVYQYVIRPGLPIGKLHAGQC